MNPVPPTPASPPAAAAAAAAAATAAANDPSAQLAAADRLHSAAVKLLRRLRVDDDAGGLTAPRMSALSVLVFVGPQTMGALAAREQVRPPTITRLVQDMTRDGLVRVVPDRDDARVRYVHATAKGKRLLIAGRDRRVQRLAAALAALPTTERQLLDQAAALLLALAPTL